MPSFFFRKLERITFNFRFFYELKHKVHLSQTVCVGFFIFDSASFLLKFIFFFNKMHGRFDLKHHKIQN